jgi:hypothetical protein
MKLPEKIPNEVGTVWAENSIPYKLNQLIDYLAEREVDIECDCCGWDDHGYQHEPNCSTKLPTLLFKSKDITVEKWVNKGFYLDGFKTKTEAEQAREALLKISKN